MSRCHVHLIQKDIKRPLQLMLLKVLTLNLKFGETKIVHGFLIWILFQVFEGVFMLGCKLCCFKPAFSLPCKEWQIRPQEKEYSLEKYHQSFSVTSDMNFLATLGSP